MSTKNDSDIESYPCPSCDRTFDTERGMHIHHAKAHGEKIALLTVDCDRCGAEIQRHKSEVERTERTYCSKGCERNRTETECDYCGKTYTEHVWRLESRERTYCNPECSRQWISENKSGEDAPSWKGGDILYAGPKWRINRQKALERDGYECVNCDLTRADHYDEWGTDLNVHHIVPRRDHDDLEHANRLENLVTLCRRCHDLYEGTYLSPVHHE